MKIWQTADAIQSILASSETSSKTLRDVEKAKSDRLKLKGSSSERFKIVYDGPAKKFTAFL
jgi:hypothetical protein